MPLPKPKKEEKKQDFIDRCMSNDQTNKDFPDNKQRFAVCNDLWRDKSKGTILSVDFVKRTIEHPLP